MHINKISFDILCLVIFICMYVCVCVVKSVSAERREGDMGNLLGKEKL